MHPRPAKDTEALAVYTNPVYRHSFPDPFVLKYAGRYYAYATGSGEDGVFLVLTSDDLVNWRDVGHAMPLPKTPAMHYWAPEVTYSEGKFNLYYSVGHEILMELRVAVAENPEGPFGDASVKLTTQDFAIDPHVFTDRDGMRWMFYATDFLDYSHIGTGTVIDKMQSWTKLEGKPRPVTRAKFDWQVYDPERKEKGGVRWHTVEGPAVIERKGVYFEMFSGGNWQNSSYGVSFAVSDDLKSKVEWQQYADGERTLPIIRTTPEVHGPGHNSIVCGPNGRELYCVYHRWTDSGRVMAIDRMDVVGRRLYVVGPTTTPQPAPLRSKDVPTELPSSCLIEFIAATKGKIRLLDSAGKELCSFKTAAAREYRLEIDGRWCHVVADGWETLFSEHLSGRATKLDASGDNQNARITPGFEDLFDRGEIAKSDWRIITGTVCDERDRQLFLTAGDTTGGIGREQQFDEIEMVVNAGLETSDSPSAFGLALYDANGEQVFSMLVSADGVDVIGSSEAAFPLPTDWDLSELHAYRIMTRGGKVSVWLEQYFL
ncbi:MAG: glycoside hydrolase family 43 protein, partial [Acidobacteria bacterium]|nr:glycoside hydrolase family 43 protein [Acidobacteriota bacterium]